MVNETLVPAPGYPANKKRPLVGLRNLHIQKVYETDKGQVIIEFKQLTFGPPAITLSTCKVLGDNFYGYSKEYDSQTWTFVLRVIVSKGSSMKPYLSCLYLQGLTLHITDEAIEAMKKHEVW